MGRPASAKKAHTLWCRWRRQVRPYCAQSDGWPSMPFRIRRACGAMCHLEDQRFCMWRWCGERSDISSLLLQLTLYIFHQCTTLEPCRRRKTYFNSKAVQLSTTRACGRRQAAPRGQTCARATAPSAHPPRYG
eukprot:scaffold20444_cov71-Phaeocystis_antarctica.AAC.9